MDILNKLGRKKYFSIYNTMNRSRHSRGENLFWLLDKSYGCKTNEIIKIMLNIENIMADIDNQKKILIAALNKNNNNEKLTIAYDLISSLNIKELSKISHNDKTLSVAINNLYETLLSNKYTYCKILELDNTINYFNIYLDFLKDSTFERIKLTGLRDMRKFLSDKDNKDKLIKLYDEYAYEKLLSDSEELWTSINTEESYKQELKEIIDLPDIDFDKYLKIFNETKNLDMIPTLFWYLTLRDSSIKKSVVKELTSFIQGSSNKEYLYISKEFRRGTLNTYNNHWEKVYMEYLLEDYMTEDEKIMILGLASFHCSGFMREKALNELIKYDESKIFKFIIIRCCDWVSSIRKQAQDLLIKMINVKNIKYIIENMMLISKIKENIEGLKTYFASDVNIEYEEEFYEKINLKIHNILKNNEYFSIVRSTLLENVYSKDKYVLEYSLKVIINNDLLNNKDTIQLASKIKNPIICVKCIKLILAKLSDTEVIYYKSDLDKIEGYRSKVELIRRLYSARYFKDVYELKQYALSKYAPVRDIARFYMRNLGFTDFTEFYLECLNDPIHKKSSLLGLCETCTYDNIEMIIKYFKIGTSKIQKKILNKIIEFSDNNLDKNYDIFFESLQNKNKSVAKLGKSYLKQNSEFLDKDMILDYYHNKDNEFAKEALAEILCTGNGWVGVYYSLKLISNDNEIGRRIAQTSINNWISEKHSYIVRDLYTDKVKYYGLSKMNTKLAEEIKNMMKKNGHLITDSNRKTIEGFILNYS